MVSTSFIMDDLTSQPFLILIFLSIGLFSVLKNAIFLTKWIFITFLRPAKKLTNYGSWALVTGSTDGIGKAIAYELAKNNLNLVLVSRSSQKLEQVSSEIRSHSPKTQVKNNFSTDDPDISDMIRGLDIGVLVNNVGVTYPGARFFDQVEEDVWMNLVRVNVIATTMVTKAVLPGMIERKRGAIVNVGSGASIVVPSHPLYAVYGATKGYIDQLSRCMHVEYKKMGIHVQCQVPLYVKTNMASRVANIGESSFFVPNAEVYAKSAVSRIGYEARCTPWWTHSIQWTLVSFLPHSFVDQLRFSTGIRRMRNSAPKSLQENLNVMK